MHQPRVETSHPTPGSRRARPFGPALAACAALGLVLAPAAARAGDCVRLDEDKDGLAANDRKAAVTLFEDALGEAGVDVVSDGCSETWRLYHVQLGESITVVVQGPKGSLRERVDSIEDLPGIYGQMTKALVAGNANTADADSLDRRDVTETQRQRKRVSADSVWYAKLGYGSTVSSEFHAGPAFGFGRRWELDRFGIDVGFLGFTMYQDSDEFDGVSASWIDLSLDYFFDPYANSSAYFGAGLSLGHHSIPETGGAYEGTGLQGKVKLGYEMFRVSTIRIMAQVDATLPFFRLSRSIDLAGEREEEHVYIPTLALSLGLGWGNGSD
jgi:hypothetical protein